MHTCMHKKFRNLSNNKFGKIFKKWTSNSHLFTPSQLHLLWERLPPLIQNFGIQSSCHRDISAGNRVSPVKSFKELAYTGLSSGLIAFSANSGCLLDARNLNQGYKCIQELMQVYITSWFPINSSTKEKTVEKDAYCRLLQPPCCCCFDGRGQTTCRRIQS